MDYWKEAFMAALEEAGIPLPDDQKLKQGGEVLAGAHENYGMAFRIPQSTVNHEVVELKKQLEDERNKVHCRECGGNGRITTHLPGCSVNSECWKCHGEGRVAAIGWSSGPVRR